MNEILETKSLTPVSEMTPSHMAERTRVGHEANTHAALPVVFFLVKSKVLPTRRQLNMSPVLLVSYFSLICQSLSKAPLPHPEPHRYEVSKTSQHHSARLKDGLKLTSLASGRARMGTPCS